MTNPFKAFRKAPPEWFAHAPRVFKDSQGDHYRRYDDEMQIPILRMDQLQIITRELGNRVDDRDLGAFLENHESIILSDKSADEKLKLLHQHVSNLKSRTDALASPDLLMKMVCALYIREDQDPFVWDELLEADKHTLLMKEQSGGLAGFFYKLGLNGFLPSPDNLLSGTETLLKKSQELSKVGRQQESEIGAVFS